MYVAYTRRIHHPVSSYLAREVGFTAYRYDLTSMYGLLYRPHLPLRTTQPTDGAVYARTPEEALRVVADSVDADSEEYFAAVRDAIRVRVRIRASQ